MIKKLKYGTGWIPDYPDIRDYSIKTPKIASLLKLAPQPTSFPNLGIPNLTTTPEIVDLRANCSPVRNQWQFGACTAFAACGILEYFEKKTFGKHIEASPMFLYKVTRNAFGWNYDSGATNRSAIGTLAGFGVCQEYYWPYADELINEEPTSYHYAQAQNYKALSYFRLDINGISPQSLLDSMKAILIKEIPIMVGFSIYESFIISSGVVPDVNPSETVQGGHSLGIFGFNDKTGHFIAKNSWGQGWGDRGYCYIPYSYVLSGIMADLWVILRASWLDTDNFNKL